MGDHHLLALHKPGLPVHIHLGKLRGKAVGRTAVAGASVKI